MTPWRRVAIFAAGGATITALFTTAVSDPPAAAAVAAAAAMFVDNIRSAPRALRTAGWALRSAAEYKALEVLGAVSFGDAS